LSRFRAFSTSRVFFLADGSSFAFGGLQPKAGADGKPPELGPSGTKAETSSAAKQSIKSGSLGRTGVTAAGISPTAAGISPAAVGDSTADHPDILAKEHSSGATPAAVGDLVGESEAHWLDGLPKGVKRWLMAEPDIAIAGNILIFAFPAP
jgi:hypothetical protein